MDFHSQKTSLILIDISYSNLFIEKRKLRLSQKELPQMQTEFKYQMESYLDLIF